MWYNSFLVCDYPTNDSQCVFYEIDGGLRTWRGNDDANYGCDVWYLFSLVFR